MIEPPDVLSTKLFVKASVARNLECVICTNAFQDPVQCKSCGRTLCRGCVEDMMKSAIAKKQCPTCRKELTLESVVPNLSVKNLMGTAIVRCFTRLPELEAANISTSSNGGSTDVDADDDDIDGDDKDQAAAAAGSSGKRKSSNSSSGAAAEKKSKPDRCTWTGELDDARAHFNTCMYAGVVCRLGCGEVIKRIDMPEHEASDCPKRRAVPCTNAGCTDVMPEPLLAAHKKNDCQFEKVDCPFQSVGCNERLLRKDVKNHVDAAVNQHMLLLLQDNKSLRGDNQTLRQNNRSLQQKVAELEEAMEQEDAGILPNVHLLEQRLDGQEGRLNRQLNEIVFKVNATEFLRGGEVAMYSDAKMVGAYLVYMSVKKGYVENGDSCGVHLHLDVGPFPCRVIMNIDVVNWDGVLASNRRVDFAHTYEYATGYGPSNLIALSQLTAPGTPYVRDGHVTFIVRFQILPLQ